LHPENKTTTINNKAMYSYIIILIFSIALAVRVYKMFTSSKKAVDKKLKRENDILWCVIYIVVILNRLSKVTGLDF